MTPVTFILFLFVSTYSGGGDGVTSHLFPNKASCKAAGIAAVQHLAYDRRNRGSFLCLPWNSITQSLGR